MLMDIAQRLLDLAYSGKYVDTVAEAAGNEILTLRERVKELEYQLKGVTDAVENKGLREHPAVPDAEHQHPDLG